MILHLRRIIPRVGYAQEGDIELKDTDEARRYVLWFIDLFPLTVSREDLAKLQEGAKRHVNMLVRLDRLIDKKYKPSIVLMAVPPREYQILAAEMLLERGFLLLGDDVGLGKTVSALCALTDPRTLPAIVVTLSGMMPLQWQRMTARFLPDLKTHVVTKGKPYELPRVDRRGPDVVILNYHKLDGWADTLAQYGRYVIFDECQELRRSGSLKYDAATRLARAMRWKIGCSATPIFNYGGEIWNVLNVLQEDVLGTHAEFEREWCTGSSGRHSFVKDPKALGSYLRAEHIMLRRTRAEVGRELPELQRIPQFVESDEKALDSIKDSAAELARIILTREKTDGWDRLRAHEQFSMVLRQATGVAKAPHVADFVRILVDNGEPVVVYAWHREVYSLLQAKLADLAPVLFTGSETPEQKEEARRKFMAGETKVILMSLRAGQGVDGFQDICRTVIFAELDWSPGVHQQCVGRVHRDGQNDPVVAYFLVSDRGSDPTIAEKLGLKTAQVEGIRNPDADIIEEIQTDENRILDLARGYLERIGRKDLIDEKVETQIAPE
jgi:SNF2 family DNA or RNA helicase